MANIQIYGTLPGGGSDIEIATEINAQSTNEKAAGAKAVYDALPTNFTGTDGTANGTNGLVPAPTTSDVDKFLNSDGTWKEAGGGGLEEKGVFVITLNELFTIDSSYQKNITDTTEKNKFLPVVQFMFDNLRVTPLILLKSTELRNNSDAMPAIWLTSNEGRINETTSVSFYNMYLVHPRNSSFFGKINQVTLNIRI